MAPTEEPAIAVGVTPISSSTSSTVICAIPRAPPPPSARARDLVMLMSSVPFSLCLRAPSRNDIGFEEIVALEQQRLLPHFRQSVCKAITEIERRRMAGTSEFDKSLPRQPSLPLIHAARFDCKCGQDLVQS